MLFTLGYVVNYDFLIDLGCFRIHDSTVDDWFKWQYDYTI
jgi:hypothetical protein